MDAMPHHAEVTACCFGDFSLHIGGRPVDCWHAGKARSLFQYLLVNRDKVIRREKLFETLWPGVEWSPTASSLKVAMHAVRRVLDRSSSTSPVEVISRNHGYLLQAIDLWVDVDDFDRSMAAGRTAESRGAHAVARAAYQRATVLYSGDFLATEDDDWVIEQREWHRAQVLYALSYLRADALRRADHATVIELCGRILQLDPYHEETYQTLMLLHGQRGELGQVRNWHQICVRRLRRDLRVPLADTTQRIFGRAIRGELRAPGRWDRTRTPTTVDTHHQCTQSG
jgi:two-component SAPR family response regulator